MIAHPDLPEARLNESLEQRKEHRAQGQLCKDYYLIMIDACGNALGFQGLYLWLLYLGFLVLAFWFLDLGFCILFLIVLTQNSPYSNHNTPS